MFSGHNEIKSEIKKKKKKTLRNSEIFQYLNRCITKEID